MRKRTQLPKTKEGWIKLAVQLLVVAVLGWVAPNFLGEESNQNKADTTPTTQTSSTTSDEKVAVEFKRVVDGDTIIVMMNNQEVRVRYLMIDTPESVKEGLQPQPFGKESAKRNEAILQSAKQVYVVFDKGPRTDDYDRYLAYVYADDILVAEQLLKEGLASVSYVNPPNNSLEAQFRQAQDIAKKQKLNIWSIDGYVNSKGKFTQQ
ncbi:MAG: thermonuclease family protein [Aerococcaceae bacterium]|nr:thermonuclease family protein [Aerococcaceae bacterium]